MFGGLITQRAPSRHGTYPYRGTLLPPSQGADHTMGNIPQTRCALRCDWKGIYQPVGGPCSKSMQHSQ